MTYRTFTDDEFIALYAENLSDLEIAKRLGVTRAVTHKRRQNLGLPSNYRAPIQRALAAIDDGTLDPATLSVKARGDVNEALRRRGRDPLPRKAPTRETPTLDAIVETLRANGPLTVKAVAAALGREPTASWQVYFAVKVAPSGRVKIVGHTQVDRRGTAANVWALSTTEAP